MPDFFSSAAAYITPIKASATPKRAKLMQDLTKILMNSPFFTAGEKEKMSKVMTLFSDAILGDLKETLIRQNLRYFKNKLSS